MDGITVADILMTIFGTGNAAFWGHYFMTKRNKQKLWDALRDRVLKLEQTSVKEHNVKELVEESIQPIERGIEDIKLLMVTMQGDITEMKLDQARREGAEEALEKAKLDLHKS